MRKLALLALFVLSTSIQSARAQFCPGVSPWVFDDVPASDPFCGYITWMAENGITLGCQVIDANHRLYCPGGSVSRSQMAAFMNRLGNIRVEAVGTGPGLLGGPITSTGTITLAATQLLPTVACTNNQIPRWNGSAWACANDANSGGTVTSVASGTGLTGGPITASGTLAADTTYLQRRVSTACAVGSSIRAIAADGSVTCQADNTGPANAFVQGGNAFGATAVLGTTDNNALDVRVSGARAMRLEPTGGGSPNVIGGHPNNAAIPFYPGQTIAGGGAAGAGCYDPPTGGSRSCANLTSSLYATVSGGYGNQSNHFWSTVSGGTGNTASGSLSVVGGGAENIAGGTYSTVVGGHRNTASGYASLAAGTYARTQTADGTPTIHDGAFVWADNTVLDFNTQASNEFAARATGGVRFVTAIDGSGNPTRTVKINPNGELEFGNQLRQMLNLYGPNVYGIGVQASTLYARSDNNFAWFLDGVHSDNMYDPGAGGLVLATLQPGASATAVFGVFRAQVLTQTSDRESKSDFAAADPADILAKVLTMPISTWSFKTEQSEGTRHIGPTAQDFKARFNVGYDDKTIATVDADGVALAAIQGLNAKVESQAREIAELKRQHAAQIAELRHAIETLMARTSSVKLAAR
jgi:hypothetical protein